MGGLEALASRWKCEVFGPAGERIAGLTTRLHEGERVSVPGLGLALEVLDVPGHTAGHIAYVGEGVVFCGDTLFACGCGRLFEGTPAQMVSSLSKLAHLPGDTRVYCAHEYTMANIRFALAVEPGNAKLAERRSRRCRDEGRGPPDRAFDHRRRARHQSVPALVVAGSRRLGLEACRPRARLARRGLHRGARMEERLPLTVADFTLRPAQPRDCGELNRLILALADYEKLSEQATPTPEGLREALFGARPACEAVIAVRGGRTVGFALFFTTFSTFLCRPGLYLEDLFVEPEHRGRGLGKAMLRHLAALAVERNCGRFEWRVLDWNEPSIRFYESIGGQLLPEWQLVRMTHADFSALALRFAAGDPA